MAPLPLGFNLGDCITAAAADVNLKLEVIGLLMGLSKSHWSHIVHGQQHFPLDLLLRAAQTDADARRFASALLGRIRHAMGWERRSLESLLMRALDIERKRMARASLRPAEEERRRA